MRMRVSGGLTEFLWTLEGILKFGLLEMYVGEDGDRNWRGAVDRVLGLRF
jgi:hypothetical protein